MRVSEGALSAREDAMHGCEATLRYGQAIVLAGNETLLACDDTGNAREATMSACQVMVHGSHTAVLTRKAMKSGGKGALPLRDGRRSRGEGAVRTGEAAMRARTVAVHG